MEIYLKTTSDTICSDLYGFDLKKSKDLLFFTRRIGVSVNPFRTGNYHENVHIVVCLLATTISNEDIFLQNGQ